jgi:hypothetical protein
MMNVLELQDKLKNFSEDQLVNEMQQPSGSVPQYLVLSEINRRKRIRDDYQQQQQGQQSNMTVAQEKIAAAGVPQEGIAGLAESMAPQTDMTMNTGATPDQTMPMPEAPAPMAEAQPDMAGGIASMAKGGYVRRLQVGGPPSDGVVVRNGMQFTVNPDGSVTDPNGQLVTDPAVVADILGQEAPQEERSWGQRNIGDPLRSFFQPIGDAAKEIGQPIGEAATELGQPIGEKLEEIGQPIGEAMRGVFDATAEEPVTAVSPSAPTPRGPVFEELGREVGGASILDMANTASALTPKVESERPVYPGWGANTDMKPYQSLREYLAFLRGDSGGDVDNTPTDAELMSGLPASDIERLKTKQPKVTDAAAAAETDAAVAPPQATTNQGLSFGLPSADTGIIDVGQRPDLSFGTAVTDSKATTTTSAPSSRTSSGGGGGGGGGAGSVDSQIIEMLKEREKRAENDKWLALAQAGMALMSSTQPTLGGALGEAGAEGLKSFRASRDEYDSAKMDLLKTQQAMAKARASGASARDYNTPTAIGSALDRFTQMQKGLLGKGTQAVTDPYTGETSYETVYQTYSDLSPESQKLYDSYSANIARLTQQYGQFFPADMTQ